MTGRPHVEGHFTGDAGVEAALANRRAPPRLCDAQAPVQRVPLVDGTLVATPDVPPARLGRSLLAISDVLGTGSFAADAASMKAGSTVAVVGDSAVGRTGGARDRSLSR